MASFSQGQIAKFIRGIGVRQIRLGCGLVLFAYLVSHFLNHALGNISMDALATGVYYHAGFWQFLLAAAVLVPTLAVLGLYQGGRSVVDSDSVEWRAENLSPRQVGTAVEQGVLESIEEYFLIGYLGLLGLVLLARGARALNERRGGMITLSYGNGRTVRVPKGLSVLEASLRNNVPHASVCGGRARCSTCRIRIIGDYTSLPEPSKREAFVLDRVGAGSDPAIRLACQLRPEADLSFFQIFLPQITAASLRTSSPSRIGEERS